MQFDIVRRRPLSDTPVFVGRQMRAEVVQQEAIRHLRRVERAQLSAERQQRRPVLGEPHVPVRTVLALVERAHRSVG